MCFPQPQLAQVFSIAEALVHFSPPRIMMAIVPVMIAAIAVLAFAAVCAMRIRGRIRPAQARIGVDAEPFQMQVLPSAPPSTIPIYIADGVTGVIMLTATVWLLEDHDERKVHQTYDILKKLYLRKQKLSTQTGDYLCVVNGIHRRHSEIVAATPAILPHTVVFVWPKDAWHARVQSSCLPPG